MASLSFGALGAKFREHKSKCKPAIFKKWSRSEKDKRRSVDLDRAWEEQEEQNRSSQALGGPLSPSTFTPATVAGAEAAAAVAGGRMQGTVGELGLGHGSTASVQPHSHARSISGTSHVSVATSNSSNGMPAPRQAGGTFVHPFQQMPRTSTPPMLSYANSMASMGNVRDHSPTTITEDENDGEDDDAANNRASLIANKPCTSSSNNNNNNEDDNDNNSHKSHNSQTINSAVYTHQVNLIQNQNLSQPALNLQQRPQLASQRTSSSTYIPNVHSNPPNPPPQPLRIKTSRTTPSISVHSSRLANDTSGADLYLDCIVDSPTSPKLPIAGLTSPTSAITPMGPFRSSLDGGVSRLRAKSDLDTVTRAEHVRAARRKYEMKERAKEEKYAREEIKRRERADNKRAHEIEKQLAAHHKEQMAARAREDAAELEQAIQRGKHNRKVSNVTNSGRPSLSIARPSLTLGRPSMSRKNTSGPILETEKLVTNNYDNTNPHSPPAIDREAITTSHSIPITSPKRRNTAKKKTRSAWTSFILWLRTKLFRLGRR